MSDIKDSVHILKDKPYILYGPHEIINKMVGGFDVFFLIMAHGWPW